MKIDTVSVQNQYCTKNNVYKTPSFEAIHPVRYFLKDEYGAAKQIRDGKVIKLLQRRLITWLNKPSNNAIRRSQGKAPRAESAINRDLGQRFIRFFFNNDKDYSSKMLARSFYLDRAHGETDAYIFTGQSADIIDANAQKIVQAKSSINDKIGMICDQYGVSAEKAKSMFLGQDDVVLSDARRNYFHTIKEILGKRLAENNLKDTVLDVYYVPIKKGKNIDYRLENAMLQHSMK